MKAKSQEAGGGQISDTALLGWENGGKISGTTSFEQHLKKSSDRDLLELCN